MKFHYHPILFGLITILAIVELGLTGWEHHEQSNFGIHSGSVRRRLDFLIFVSAWTTLTGAAYIVFGHTGRFGLIASFASHAFWLFWTWIMWLVGAALYQSKLNSIGCGFTNKMCHINHGIEGIAWIEMALTFITLWVIILHIGGKTERYRSGPYDV